MWGQEDVAGKGGYRGIDDLRKIERRKNGETLMTL